VCLGSFIPWDVKKQSAIIRDELGWRGEEVENVPPGYDYEKIECCLQGVRDYTKYIKRGYSRPAHLASIDIRNGRLSREEALELLAEYENRRPPSLDLFLKFVGLTEAEFTEIAKSHGVSPYRHDERLVRRGKKVHDFDLWPQYGDMSREEAMVQLERFLRRDHSRRAAATG